MHPSFDHVLVPEARLGVDLLDDIHQQTRGIARHEAALAPGFAVGETEIGRFGPVGGPAFVNENRYLAIEPHRRIVYATSLCSKGALTFAGTVAAEFEPTAEGTRPILFEQGLYFDGRDEVVGHRSGWESMLTALGRHLRSQP